MAGDEDRRSGSAPPKGISSRGGEGRVPKATSLRLSWYLRELERLRAEGQETVSSRALGALLGVSDAQVRKDLTLFGTYGCAGVGYRCDELIAAIRRILGTHRMWPTVVVGTGNLGQALLNYGGFDGRGFQIVAALDSDPLKVGLEIGGIPVRHVDEMSTLVKQRGIHLAVLAVPAEAAQTVADQLVEAGIQGILNFAPKTIIVPDDVCLVEVDVTVQLEQLSFAVVRRRQNA